MSTYHVHIQNFVSVSNTRQAVDKTALKEMLNSLQQIKQEAPLDEDQHNLLSDDIQKITSQLELKKPRKTIIKTCLTSIRMALGGAINHIAVADVITKINALLGMIK